MKIFVSAYACEPNLGSEIGVGWHWVLEMSKYFELWVLTRESNRENIEPWIAEHPEYSGIHWLYYDLPKWARWWKRGLRGVRTYYNIWQWMTNGIVKKTMQKEDIHVFHHLTYGNALWKVSSYGQEQTFIWGPIGGLETIPKEFSKHYGWKWRMIEMVRRLTVALLPVNTSFQKRCKHANLIFCKTEATRSLIPGKYRTKAMLMTDVAVDIEKNRHNGINRNDDKTTILTVGRLDAWRGFDLVIEAFNMLAEKQKNVELHILGDGSDKTRLTKMINASTARENIKLPGNVSQEQYNIYMQNCGIVVNAALKEGAVTTSFDAIANGKPLVCIESGGYTRTLKSGMCEIVAKHDRQQTIHELCKGMERFCKPEERHAALDECHSMTKELSWETKGKTVRDAILGIAE